VQVDASGKGVPVNWTYVDANGVAWSLFDWSLDDTFAPAGLLSAEAVYATSNCTGAPTAYFAIPGELPPSSARYYTKVLDWSRTAIQVITTTGSSGTQGLPTFAKGVVTAPHTIQTLVYHYAQSINPGQYTCQAVNGTVQSPTPFFGFTAAELQPLARPAPQVTLPLHYEVRG